MGAPGHFVKVGGGADGLHGGQGQGAQVRGFERGFERVDARQGVVESGPVRAGCLDEILRGVGHARHELLLDFVALGVLVYLEETEHHWLL
ncbi:Uncharacterised protein [Achromobacter xylosoxidans]|nr:Uncharacterised protein [Achromobacter xylosoxidans]CUJ91598.1 Uncharacterised protein [Achromobacter xylosoxidans]